MFLLLTCWQVYHDSDHFHVIILGRFKHLYMIRLVSLKPAYVLFFTVISVAMDGAPLIKYKDSSALYSCRPTSSGESLDLQI